MVINIVLTVLPTNDVRKLKTGLIDPFLFCWQLSANFCYERNHSKINIPQHWFVYSMNEVNIAEFTSLRRFM
jgi:hypothetical protein